ncbi:amidohydrolase family protein [Fulvivirga sedimenti]|uniref:Amidohydrolase family protein n=1 Tax=Fulvivirga sedimenti TaxID=2879465 RepID=A0A9X1HTI2_9BACT|nr:amidohydrolase family protein [Fulvivirga sedimenti]MCA6075511.1 amidohydrolase family protein [Fulvivirga sedimenti]MCA6076688.1 amidohydrolase family protein [Fulvivirga sedimenti]MCA6077816.1 amidohydrolase family protein [Fulvivirga sedimenti]
MKAFSLIALLILPFLTFGQVTDAPERTEGEGPWPQLIIRGVMMIKGDGAPPTGPVDIVVRNNRIEQIRIVGYPGVAIDPDRRPKLEKGGKELDATGMYLMPGFIDMHGHIGGSAQGTPAEYVFKLWMAHGITTIRDPSAGNGLDWVLDHKQKSQKNTITAPRILAYTSFGQGSTSPISTPEMAREWVQNNAKNGADGIKFFGAAPDIMEAALMENKKLGLRSACHHAQMDVARWNVLNSARAGLTSMEHWYGLPEALFTDRTVQNYPLDYNYNNEQHRFGEAGRLWQQAAAPYTEKWNAVMNELLELDFTLDPTFNIYEASRDLMRARRAEWHEDYTLPSLWRFYQPSKISHGSYWHFWGTEEEVAWKENYRLWMTFINEYKNRGGRVTAGSDSGFIFQLYGFAYIRELELLREAGFHPLEVIRSATLNGAEALGLDKDLGTVEVGKLADFVIVEENPLQNLKVLYGTGAIKLTDENDVVRVGGVKYTIKDGIIYDAKKLLQDVKELVDASKEEEGFEIKQPGF